jgi:arylsulfatase A-like enzyme
MIRTSLLLALVFTLASCGSIQPPEKQPNIILIMADDIGVEGIGAYGGTSYKTPKIDKMAQEGVRFTHAYAQPLCSNTRLQLMTGLFNNRNWKYFGIMDPKEKTIGHYMQEAGYTTCMAGKWQLQSYDPVDYPGSEKRRGTGMHPKDAGFNDYSLYHSLHTEDKGYRYAKPTYLENGKLIKKSADKYGPDMWVDFINNFVDKNSDKEDPFFVYYAMALPHWPMVLTPHSKDWKKGDRFEPDTKHFKDMTEYMDYCVGRILDHLDKKNLAEDTMVIFYSDNGTHLDITSDTINGKVAGGKGWTTDAGTHVPLIVRWKGHIQPNISNELTDSTDLLATCVHVAGSEVDRKIDGVSIYPNLMDPKHKIKDHIFCFYDPRPGWDKDQFTKLVFARDKRYKLYEDGRLFDIEKDVLEQKPYLKKQDTPELKEKRQELKEVLENMQKPL